ncbi:MAG TPA: hypothetical protein VGD60_00735 [Candidatus Acidoferrales bacterium]
MAYNGSSPYVNTFGSATTSGNLLVSYFNGLAGATPTILSDASEVWHPIFDDTATMSGYHNTTWWAISKGCTVVTASESSVGGLAGICSGEWSLVNQIDQGGSGTVGTGTTTPAITTTHAVETIIAFWSANTPFGSAGSTFTFRCGVNFSGDYYTILGDYGVTSIQTSLTATPSGGSGGSAGIASFCQGGTVFTKELDAAMATWS